MEVITIQIALIKYEGYLNSNYILLHMQFLYFQFLYKLHIVNGSLRPPPPPPKEPPPPPPEENPPPPPL